MQVDALEKFDRALATAEENILTEISSRGGSMDPQKAVWRLSSSELERQMHASAIERLLSAGRVKFEGNNITLIRPT